MPRAAPLDIPECAGRYFSYDPETGLVTRLVALGSRKAGSVLTVTAGGYVRTRFQGHFIAAHRLAWFLMTGEQPLECIDHIDGDPTNNKWSNLRTCRHYENMSNCRKRRNGLKGVSPTRSGTFQAKIGHRGREYSLGTYPTEIAAHAAYVEAAARLHGEFARTE